MPNGYNRSTTAPLRVLMMHAKYRVLGGEDVSHRSEAALLHASGYVIEDYTVTNDDFAKKGAFRSLTDMTFNLSVYKEVQSIARRFRPDVVYVNNTFPALSPSAIFAVKAMKIPVVQVLRNYRVGCIAGTVFRDGQECQLCVGRAIPIAGVRHACYRDSKAASGATTLAKAAQKSFGLLDAADMFIAVSEYVKKIAVSSGLDSGRIVVRPNLVWPDPMPSYQPAEANRTSLVFVGRDSYDKGLHVLLQAVSLIQNPALKVEVYGCAEPSSVTDERVIFHGAVHPSAIAPAMTKAMGVVVPSIWPEPFGRVVIEALACGSPVIASRVGGMADFSGPGVALVPPDDPRGLAEAITKLLDSTVHERSELSKVARHYYEGTFAPSRWLDATQGIFDQLLSHQ